MKTEDLPKILGPGMQRENSYIRFVDLDCKDDKIYGLDDAAQVPYPHRDGTFVGKFDDHFQSERARREKEAEIIRKESYADVFIEYMNVFDFDQKDMINQDDRVEYVAYLKNIEKSLGKKTDKEINIFGKGKVD